jgi:multiple sugar transport system permease protein
MVGDRGWRKAVVVLLFLLPSLAGLLLFSIFPILASLVLTLFEWNLLRPPRFVGLANFQALAVDDGFGQALLHTLGFIGGYLPLAVAAGLGLALALDRPLPGRAIFRVALFAPVVSAWVAVALVWKWIFNPIYGLLNYLLGLVGIGGPQWLFDPAWAMPAVVLTSVWKDMGFLMVMFLAGLQGIPREYYEAASTDGASAVRRFWHITLPLLTPTLFFAVVISLINSFQVFDQVWVMTGGGPAGATSVLVEQIVKSAFNFGKMGYAAALSWVLFALVFAVTAVQLAVQRRWVIYD